MTSVRDILVIGVILLVTGFFMLAGYYLTNQALSKFKTTPQVASDSQAVTAITSVSNQTERFDYIFFAVFMGLMFGIIITGWFVPANTIYAFFYIIILLFSIGVSPILSNMWHSFTQFAVFSTITSLPLTTYVLEHLPIIMTILGLIGLVILFGKPYLVGEQI